MAANNYFGFTHSGTQYGAASAAAYPTAQPGYPVAPTATAATYSPQRPATGYETAYQTAAAAAAPATYAVGAGTAAAPPSYDYGYGAPAQTAYNTAKTYYQQPAAGAAAYSTTETHYQPSKPAYSATNTYTATNRQAAQGVPKAAAYTTSYTAQPPQPCATSYASGYNAPAVVQTQTNTKSAYSTNQTNSGAATFTTNYSAASVPNQPAPKPKAPNTSYSNYDAAVYSAATLYAAQQSTNTTGPASGAVGQLQGTGVAPSGSNVVNKLQTSGATKAMSGGSSGTWHNNYRKGPVGSGLKQQFCPKQPPKQQQVHYCDVCKISCAGPQTYREHLEGQKHKKKEAMLKAGASTASSQNALKCELCDVDCTGSDAYAAHIRGARHQKVVKLHTRLGKPIPSTDPVVQGKVGTAGKISTSSNSSSGTTSKKPMTITTTTSTTPKINFNPSANMPVMPGSSLNPDAKDDDDGVVDKDVQPVGQDYIEEIKNEEGKSTSFMCKLCECRFNDPNAKEMHMKGRRHRLQYKKKVNPELVVEVKPSLRQRKGMEDKQRRMHFREDVMRRREEERMMRGLLEEEERIYWEERRRYEEEMEYFEWCRRYGRDPRPLGPPGPRFGPPGPGGPPGMMPPFFQPPMMRRPDSMEDRHVMARHTEIYPSEEELSAVQKIVSHSEKALKFVSDHLAEISQAAGSKGAVKPGTPKTTQVKPPTTPVKSTPPTPQTPSGSISTPPTPSSSSTSPASKPIKKEDGSDGSLFSFQQGKEEATTGHRLLKGVMRVGSLAKGLLLHGDTSVNLVVLCAEKPTRSLLYKVSENLPKQLQVVAPEDKYSVKCKPEDAALVVIGAKEPHITVTITLTSPVMREPLVVPTPATEAPGDSAQAAIVKVKDPPDVLDKQKCLEALAALRHAKWFQARATQLQSCVMIIRILRDLCQRVPTWAPLHNWPMELLVEKVLSSSHAALSPGEALRRVMEALASGIMLPGGPGLMDPCEKEPVDAAGLLNAQQREDITASAQHALRLLAFRQVHKVLGMDPLPAHKFVRNRFGGTRKRRREGSGGEGNDSEAVDGKKDKKEEAVVTMETDK